MDVVKKIPLHRVRLRENSAIAVAAGAPIADVDLCGRSVAIRCAAYEPDLEQVKTLTGKDPAQGELNVAQLCGKHLLDIVHMALAADPAPPSREQLGKLPLAERLALVETATCFLLGPQVFESSPSTSPPKT